MYLSKNILTFHLHHLMHLSTKSVSYTHLDVYKRQGNYNMFIEIVCKDIQQLRAVLHDKLHKITGIDRTETLISLEENLNRSVRINE